MDDGSAMATGVLVVSAGVVAVLMAGAVAAPGPSFMTVGAVLTVVGLFDLFGGGHFIQGIASILLVVGGLTLMALGAIARGVGKARRLLENLVIEARRVDRGGS